MNLPKFFGIDIGKKSIKIAQVQQAEKNPKVLRLLSFDTGDGLLTSEDASQRSELAIRIKDAVNGAKIDTNKCVVALPEPSIFNRLLTFPDMEEKALNEAIHWNAKQFLPVAVDDVQKDWIKTAEVEKDGKKMIQLLLVAAPKKLINNTLDIFRQADLDLIAIETESVASSRAIANSYGDTGSILVIDIGAAGTDMSVVNEGKLIFSQSLGTGSDAMTRGIMTGFSLEESQAEQYKQKFGLLQNQGEGKIFQVLQPVASIISAEVTKTINFFRTKYAQSTPQKVLLIGEGAKLPGISEYLSGNLGIPVEIANLSNNLSFDGEAQKESDNRGLFSYGVALGLALKKE